MGQLAGPRPAAPALKQRAGPRAPGIRAAPARAARAPTRVRPAREFSLQSTCVCGSQCTNCHRRDERREARAHFGTYAHVHMFLALPASPLCSSHGVIQQLPKILGSKGHHDPRSLSRDTRIILTPRPHGRTLPTATQHITTPETVLRLRMFAAVIAPILPSINGDSGICSNCSSSHQAPPAHGMRAPKVLAVSKPA